MTDPAKLCNFFIPSKLEFSKYFVLEFLKFSRNEKIETRNVLGDSDNNRSLRAAPFAATKIWNLFGYFQLITQPDTNVRVLTLIG